MHAQVRGGDPRHQHCEGGVRHAPPSLARAEDGGARGDAILAVLVLEAVVVVTLDVLEKIRAVRRRHRAVDLVVGPNEQRHDDVARGEGYGVVVGEGLSSSPILMKTTLGVSLTTWGARTRMTTTTATPLPPPENNSVAPRGEGGRDNDGAG